MLKAFCDFEASYWCLKKVRCKLPDKKGELCEQLCFWIMNAFHSMALSCEFDVFNIFVFALSVFSYGRCICYSDC